MSTISFLSCTSFIDASIHVSKKCKDLLVWIFLLKPLLYQATVYYNNGI